MYGRGEEGLLKTSTDKAIEVDSTSEIVTKELELLIVPLKVDD